MTKTYDEPAADQKEHIMDTERTIGQWRVDTTTEHTDHPEIVIREMRDEDHLGNTVAVACGQFASEELRQNAWLIASAPEMHELLLRMIEIGALEGHNAIQRETIAILDQVREMDLPEE